jgi:DNA-binding NarL/FixJ family response regulator
MSGGGSPSGSRLDAHEFIKTLRLWRYTGSGANKDGVGATQRKAWVLEGVYLKGMYEDGVKSHPRPREMIPESRRPITGRHTDILQLIAQGASAKEAAQQLGIGEQTVKNHLHEIYRRLEARNSSHAVAIAIAAGYVHIDGKPPN